MPNILLTLRKWTRITSSVLVTRRGSPPRIFKRRVKPVVLSTMCLGSKNFLGKWLFSKEDATECLQALQNFYWAPHGLNVPKKTETFLRSRITHSSFNSNHKMVLTVGQIYTPILRIGSGLSSLLDLAFVNLCHGRGKGGRPGMEKWRGCGEWWDPSSRAVTLDSTGRNWWFLKRVITLWSVGTVWGARVVNHRLQYCVFLTLVALSRNEIQQVNFVKLSPSTSASSQEGWADWVIWISLGMPSLPLVKGDEELVRMDGIL